MRTKATRKKLPCLTTMVNLAQNNYSVGSTHRIRKKYCLITAFFYLWYGTFFLVATVHGPYNGLDPILDVT